MARWRSWAMWRLVYPRTTELARSGDVTALERRLCEVEDPIEENTFSERALIATALGQLRADTAVPTLASVLDASTRVDVRVCASDALRQIGGTEAARALRPALGDERYAVKRAAIEVEPRPDQEIWPKLRELATSDPEPLIRSAAVEALGRTHDDTWVPLLLSVAETDRWWVAVSALDALAELGTEESYEALRKLRSRGTRTALRLNLPIKMLGARRHLARRRA